MFFFIKKQFFLENKEFIKLEPQKSGRKATIENIFHLKQMMKERYLLV